MFLHALQHFRDRFTLRRIKSHIERAIMLKTQPTFGLLQLIRTKTQIGEQTIDFLNPDDVECRLQLIEIRMKEPHRQPVQAGPGQFQQTRQVRR